MDAKAHRREGLFEIKSLRLESMPAPDAVLVKALAATIARFAGWHDTANDHAVEMAVGEVDVPWLEQRLDDEAVTETLRVAPCGVLRSNDLANGYGKCHGICLSKMGIR